MKQQPRRRYHSDRPEVGQLPIAEDVAKELESHLAMRTDELVEQGWERAEARREAERRFGKMSEVRKECEQITKSTDRAVRRANRMDGMRQDIRYAIRSLAKTPSFTAVAVLTLALGIGANTAIFSVINAVLLQPLDYADAGQLVIVDEQQPERGNTMAVAWANFQDWRDNARGFSGMAAYGVGQTTVLGGEQPARAMTARVTEDFWEIFSIVPTTGRLLAAEEHADTTLAAALIREDFWRTNLAGAPIDQLRIALQGRPHQVVGVVSSEFDFPSGAQIWVPLISDNPYRSAHNHRVVARLRDGVTIEQVDAELDAIQSRITADVAGEDPDFIATGTRTMSLKERITGNARQPLMLLFGAAALVLLIACTNLASTLLARGSTRTREFAVRGALGARRQRLTRQLLTESLVLALLGGVVGLGLAAIVLRTLVATAPNAVPRLDEIGLDPLVLLFTLAAVLLTSLLFGLLPALRLTDLDVATTLRAGDKSSDGKSKSRIWTLLVGAEVALAFVLLTASGLLIRSFQEVMDAERGFATESVVTADVDLSLTKYAELEDHTRFYDELIPALTSRPEIDVAGVVTSVPLSGRIPNGRLELDGDLSNQAIGWYVVASAGYFETLGIPLLQGRLFDGRDAPDAQHVAVVSKGFADRYWPDQDPIGRQVTGGGMDEYWEERPFATVVGVVADAKYRSLTEQPEAVVYFPHTQRPGRLRFNATLVARGSAGGSAVPALRQVLTTLDPDVPPRFRSMDERIEGSLAQREFLMSLLGAFAFVAFTLAVVGIYGVVSYSVAKRTREMGIRIALGADRGKVRRLVQGRALGMVVFGAIIGIAGSIAVTRLLESLLFGVSATDPLTFVAVAGALMAAAWLASVIPALRSTRVDPMVSLQAE